MLTKPLSAPALFISHGAPTFALAPGRLGPPLSALGARLKGRLQAVVLVSAHWQAPELRVMTGAQPATLHDFGGFAPELYQLRYPAPGAPALAMEVMTLLNAAGYAASADPQRGYDHGAWVPLLHLLPAADVPVIQLSMPYALDGAGAYALGRALAPLRQRGIALIGSGSLTHNLGDVRSPDTEPAGYVIAFADWIKQAIAANALKELIDYRRRAPHAVRAHPSEEHFLPLLVALGAGQGGPVRLIDGGITHGAVAMDAFVWGES